MLFRSEHRAEILAGQKIRLQNLSEVERLERKERQRKYYAEHRAELIARQKAWKKANQDKVRAYKKAYRERVKERTKNEIL